MTRYKVAITRYAHDADAVKRAVDLSGAFEKIPRGGKVFIKPNIVFWTKETVFPKWGVITTSRVIEEIVSCLKDMGIHHITIGEGIIRLKHNDSETSKHAYEQLGYYNLAKRYGIKCIDIFERPFRKIDMGRGGELAFNEDIIESDYIINVPVLKTHAQTRVSLGMKNFKGIIDINSRKKCHSADRENDLDYMISLLPDVLPPCAAVIDGIYTIERGPTFDGKARRSDIIIASPDMISADMVGAVVLGHEPEQVKYLVYAAEKHNRALDLSDIEIIGEKIEDVKSYHDYTFPYNEDNTLPAAMDRAGIKGVSYYKFDNTLCTYCSFITGAMLTSIAFAWKGKAWDDVEVLTGKIMKPLKGKKKTILLGKCMCSLNRDNPDINELIEIKGCPPKPEDAVKALHRAGIEVDPAIFENLDKAPGFFMSKYKDKPEFDESFYRI